MIAQEKSSVSKKITLQSKSEPNKITAYDFDTMKFQDEILIVSTCVGVEKYHLTDLVKFSVR